MLEHSTFWKINCPNLKTLMVKKHAVCKEYESGVDWFYI